MKGQGMNLQGFGKTNSSARTISVPKSLLTMLLKRRDAQPFNDLNLVFPTTLLLLRDPSNTGRECRSA